MTDFTDGSWRSLITGDEISAIPDSVAYHYDPTAENVGEASTWTDQIAGVSLSGSYEVIESGINGLNTARFDGSSDDVANSNVTISTLPFAAVWVSQYQGDPSSDDAFYWETGTNLNFTFRSRSDGDYQAYVGGGTSTFVRNGTPDNDPHIFVMEATKPDGVRLEVDGTEIGTATGSAGAIDGITVGSRKGSSYAQADFGDYFLTVDHSDSDLQTLKNSLSSKWGISLA